MQEANKAYENGFKMSLILTITALFISIILARLFIRSLTEPLSYAVNSIQAMANNDLTKEIVITGKDEATQTSAAHLNMSATKILELAKEIDTAIDILLALKDKGQGFLQTLTLTLFLPCSLDWKVK